MDTYQEMMVKLYEVTGGKDTKAVDFKDLVKKAGLHGNYSNIFQRLHEEGWITEDAKEDYVRITQWGVAEAKKAQKPVSEEDKTAMINANKCFSAAKDFADVIETYTKDISKENLTKVEARFRELEKAFNLLKS